MQIFGRGIPTSDEVWQLYSQIAQTPDLWMAETFKEAATSCGFRKVSPRRGYFSFSDKHHMTGHAPIVGDFIEEIRLFIGQAPKDLAETLYKKDRRKIGLLASEYSALFREKLGEPRTANDNDIFEYDDHRVRVLPTDCVWVIISNLPIVRKLPNDWWAPA